MNKSCLEIKKKNLSFTISFIFSVVSFSLFLSIILVP